MAGTDQKPALSGWRRKVHEVIFEAETPSGRLFDLLLIAGIVVSVMAVVLESVATFREAYGTAFMAVEWVITIFFTLEYLLRLTSVQSPWRYARSFFGLIDLLAIIPTYLSLYFVGVQSLLVIRVIRLLRIFRVLKLVRYVGEADVLTRAIRASRIKITVFIGAVLTIVVIVGAAMYLIEGEQNGFTSIPQGMYWAIVTMTTVGYGDIVPQTVFGRILSTVIMIMGYGIIAVPTGIVSVELANISSDRSFTRVCHQCGKEGHEGDAAFCRCCGNELLDSSAG